MRLTFCSVFLIISLYMWVFSDNSTSAPFFAFSAGVFLMLSLKFLGKKVDSYLTKAVSG